MGWKPCWSLKQMPSFYSRRVQAQDDPIAWDSCPIPGGKENKRGTAAMLEEALEIAMGLNGSDLADLMNVELTRFHAPIQNHPQRKTILEITCEQMGSVVDPTPPTPQALSVGLLEPMQVMSSEQVGR